MEKLTGDLIRLIVAIIFDSILLVFLVLSVQDLVIYYLVAGAPRPSILELVDWILNAPILGSIVKSALKTLI